MDFEPKKGERKPCHPPLPQAMQLTSPPFSERVHVDLSSRGMGQRVSLAPVAVRGPQDVSAPTKSCRGSSKCWVCVRHDVRRQQEGLHGRSSLPLRATLSNSSAQLHRPREGGGGGGTLHIKPA